MQREEYRSIRAFAGMQNRTIEPVDDPAVLQFIRAAEAYTLDGSILGQGGPDLNSPLRSVDPSAVFDALQIQQASIKRALAWLDSEPNRTNLPENIREIVRAYYTANLTRTAHEK